MKSLFRVYFDALIRFNMQRGSTLAAASSFYVIITSIPLVLLVFRIIGLFLKDVSELQLKVLIFAKEFFPDVAPEIFENIRMLLEGPLYGSAPFTFLNFLILGISSLSFFNSIWSGLYLISGDRSYLSLWKHLKGIVIIGVTIFIVASLLFLPPIVLLLVKFIKQNFVINYLWDNFDSLRSILLFIKESDFGTSLLFQTSLFHGLIFLVYFTFLYRWFFSWKIKMREAFIGSLTFVGSLLIGKSLFWIYIVNVRENLIKNYGDYYTFILSLMWVFFVMCFFFYGACVCHELQKKPDLWGGREDFEQDSKKLDGNPELRENKISNEEEVEKKDDPIVD